MNKKAQVTIFIIIAILIVAGVVVFLIFRGSLFTQNIPAYAEPVYTDFLSCLDGDLLTGADILGTQAGYIELPNFEPGSAYSPFSSQLNFLGNPIPYWYYVSGNNIQKEQVPSQSQMEADLEKFIEQSVSKCSFSSYASEGYEVYSGEPSAKVTINENTIDLKLTMDLNININEEQFLIKSHSVSAQSKLGKLYGAALDVYKEEQEKLFLEEYAVDTLRLYAPVDGVEISCAPEIWNAEEVFDGLQEAIEGNTLALRKQTGQQIYFGVDLPIKENVRFINSRSWSSNFEVNPSEGALLIANPVGNQPGLGILGFCYVPYHFVYNVKYPVLVQVYDDYSEEIFQFPVAVVLEGNNPRKALNGTAVELEDAEICENKNTEINVNIYDSNLNYVEADISYECFSSSCQIGSTSFEGGLIADLPQCVNGYIIVRADGFLEKKHLYSSVNEDTVNIILDKLYEVPVELRLDGLIYNGKAIINFVSEKNSKTIVYPETKKVELSDGDYEVSVHIYQDASLNLGDTTYEQCVDVPRSGIGGILGLKQERCFNVDIPSQVISSVLAGGGKDNYYFSEQELKSLTALEINAGSLESPDSLEQLQQNYQIFEGKDLSIFVR